MSHLFTDLEHSIIADRLSLSDCLAEVLEIDYEQAIGVSESALLKLKTASNWNQFDHLEQKFIIDSVEGSTWIAGMLDEHHLTGSISSQQLATHIRVIEKLAEKLTDLAGEKVTAATS